MELAKASGDMMSVSDALVTAALGYLIVFLGMILLIWVIMLVSRIMKSRTRKPQPATEPVSPAPIQPPAPAPGSAGEVKLNNVSERDAAMIMAIVAHQLGKPLNELHFLSIRELDEEPR